MVTDLELKVKLIELLSTNYSEILGDRIYFDQPSDDRDSILPYLVVNKVTSTPSRDSETSYDDPIYTFNLFQGNTHTSDIDDTFVSLTNYLDNIKFDTTNFINVATDYINSGTLNPDGQNFGRFVVYQFITQEK